mmetsp:Transcript_127090/g.395541  ORF Transcript_127090/g.395541 Transcript_127090/m.395541 type:complete len:412 (-) Transcript_127090:137-1372(-)
MAAPLCRLRAAGACHAVAPLLLLFLAGCCHPCAGLRTEPEKPAAALRSGKPAPKAPQARTAPDAWKSVLAKEGLQTPGGRAVEPVGRHIQYLWRNHPHGLTDRLKFYFKPLVALGQHHGATVHIRGGRHGPALWLHRMHSIDIADSWDRYFDLSANGGNPFHELMNFTGCRDVDPSPWGGRRDDSWEHIFDGGVKCVNIVNILPKTFVDNPRMKAVSGGVPVSSLVRADADSFLRRNNVDSPYGSVHVRRCDRVRRNAQCTTPNAIYRQVAEHDHYTTWLFFMYAEEGYREKLREKLAPLGRRLLFEGEVELSGQFPEDNYYAYLLGKYLNGGADVILESHVCLHPDRPEILTAVPDHGIFLSRGDADSEPADGAWANDREEAYLATEEQYAAVCEDKPSSPHILPSSRAQ